MSYAVRKDGQGWRAVDSELDCTDDELYSGSQPVVVPADKELLEQASESVRFSLQAEIDTKAKALGFSGGNALMLYAGFINSFQDLAQIFAQWEASVWVEANAYKDRVIAGEAEMLTGEQAVLMMPALVLV